MAAKNVNSNPKNGYLILSNEVVLDIISYLPEDVNQLRLVNRATNALVGPPRCMVLDKPCQSALLGAVRNAMNASPDSVSNLRYVMSHSKCYPCRYGRSTASETALRGEDDLDSPLHYACESWDSEGVINLLVAAGHDLNLECGWPRQRTPLFRACEVGNYATARNLLRAGADPRRGAYANWGSTEPLPLIHRAVLPPPQPPIVNIPTAPRLERDKEQMLLYGLW
ncbi:hypothetical protein PG997_002030 [Apiospora hydei]|uniref:Uncharacterized protein n=1 Tax=Apiospora hydei TaxID=1337664 RepID=A0ABR1X8B9_9PEZI